jgi:hypothetical protein
MRARLTNRPEWLWLGFCVVMTALFSESYISSHQDHDCSGEGCPLCFLVEGAEFFSRQLKGAASCPAFSAAVLPASARVLKFAAFRSVPASAVRLKVKLNC